MRRTSTSAPMKMDHENDSRVVLAAPGMIWCALCGIIIYNYLWLLLILVVLLIIVGCCCEKFLLLFSSCFLVRQVSKKLNPGTSWTRSESSMWSLMKSFVADRTHEIWKVWSLLLGVVVLVFFSRMLFDLSFSFCDIFFRVSDCSPPSNFAASYSPVPIQRIGKWITVRSVMVYEEFII